MRARRVVGLLLFVCGLAFQLGPSVGATPVPAIAALVERVTAANSTPAVDAFGDYLARLETSEGDRRGYGRDRQPQADLVAGRMFIRATLADLLGRQAVADQAFTVDGFPGLNIIATLPGTDPAAGVLVIGAHYDSEQNAGADDDASGVAALLEAARVLKQAHLKSTIVFAVFDQEEERRNGWGLGSQAYAAAVKRDRVNVRAMIGLDMVAYNHLGGNRASVSRCDRGASTTPSAQLAARMRTALADYSGLSVLLFTGENASDPYRFYQAGIPALLVSEEFDEDGWPLNPYYHRATDFYLDADGEPQTYAGRPYLDLQYAARIVRGVVGWAATDGGFTGFRDTPRGE